MNITKQVFMDRIKKIHPDITEEELFVTGKELSVKGFAMLLAHFDSSHTRTKKPSQLWHEIAIECSLTKRILEKMDYISMFFIKDGTIYVTGLLREVAQLANQTFDNYIAKIAAFDLFNVAVIDDRSCASRSYERDMYVVPSNDKPYACYTAGMAKRKARQWQSYVLIVKVDQCERLERPTYDTKITSIGKFLSPSIWNDIKDDAPKGLYCTFNFDGDTKSNLSTLQHQELIETIFDEVLADLKQLDGKVILRMHLGYNHRYERIVEYSKKGKKLTRDIQV